MDFRIVKKSICSLFSTRERKLLFIIAVVALILNFCRLYTNCFWGDEAYSINVAKNGIVDTISYLLENDIHPPLYHILLSIFCNIFGFSPFIYHFVSYIPFFLIILISLTYVYKKYGFMTSLFLIILSSFLTSSLFFIIEVRMYEWGLFFVFCSFILLREIMERPNKRNTAVFIISSVCAAYTHHYCLLGIVFLYLALLIQAFYDKKRIKNVIFIMIVSFLAYLPWFVVTIKSILSVTKDFWIKVIPDFNECVSFLFGSNCIPALFVILIISTLLFFSKKYGGIKKFKFDPESAWVCAGLLSILGTILVTTIFSYAVRPILLTRYLYPVSIVAWTLFAFVVPRCTEKKKIVCVLIIILLLVGLINGAYTTYMERDADNSTNNILTSTSDISSDDVIYTNIQHLDWTMIDYYYDGVEHHYYDSTPTLGDRDTYWFFIDGKVETNTLSDICSQGYNFELIVHDKFAAYTDPGFVNYYDVCAYKVTRA